MIPYQSDNRYLNPHIYRTFQITSFRTYEPVLTGLKPVLRNLPRIGPYFDKLDFEDSDQSFEHPSFVYTEEFEEIDPPERKFIGDSSFMTHNL